MNNDTFFSIYESILCDGSTNELENKGECDEGSDQRDPKKNLKDKYEKQI